MNQMLQKYGLSTDLDQRVGLEFIDQSKLFLSDDITETESQLESESQVTSKSFIGMDNMFSTPYFKEDSNHINSSEI